jgi:hypothetical protein
MPEFLKQYFDTEGPFGIPMKDRQARSVESLVRALPRSEEFRYRKAALGRAPTELNPGERSDVSWISTESVDRTGEVVLARGMNDAQFQQNPVVTLGHAYWMPPVGRSLWRKRVKDGPLAGIKAKTQYPARPEGWDEPWPPDKVLALVQAGLLQGKSIGFLPLKVHSPKDRERELNGWADVELIIDEWLLLEYACVFIPANQDALVESVSKGLVALPDDFCRALGIGPVGEPAVTGFTPLAEVERAVRDAVSRVDLRAVVKQSLDRARGRV